MVLVKWALLSQSCARVCREKPSDRRSLAVSIYPPSPLFFLPPHPTLYHTSHSLLPILDELKRIFRSYRVSSRPKGSHSRRMSYIPPDVLANLKKYQYKGVDK